MTEIRFVLPNAFKSVALAAGLEPPNGADIAPCPLQVGDVIIVPPVRGIALRVVWRLYRCPSEDAEAMWLVQLEECQHPTDPPVPARPVGT